MSTAPSAPTKASKIWRRTRVGSLIALALAATLWGASRFDSGLPVLAACAVVLAAALFEVGRMGSLAGRQFAGVLSLGALGVTLMTAFVVHGARPEADVALTGATWMAGMSMFALMLTIASFAMFRGWSGPLRAAALVFLATAFFDAPQGWANGVLAWVAVIAFLFIVVLIGFYAERNVRADFAIALGLALWLVVPIPGIAVVRVAFGVGGLVALIVLCKIGDNAAYFVGSAIGRHHPFKKISPGKTTEGCVASLLSGIAAGAACVHFGLLPSEPYGWTGGCAAGALINVAAQAGDLFESWVKRRVGVKDSGAWFGPSGGILDLVDSFLFGVPAALLGWPFLFTFTAAP